MAAQIEHLGKSSTMRKPMQLGPKSFSSKTAAKAYVRSIKDAYKVGTYLSDEDMKVVLAALEMHPDCVSKTGSGVAKIGVVGNGESLQGKGFVAERVDGTTARFSYKICFEAKKRSHADRVSEACRNAVRPYIFRWRDNMFKRNGGFVRCELSGSLIEVNDCHVDHFNPSFEKILIDFWANEGFDDGRNVNVSITDGPQVEAVLSDEELASRWIRFHNSRVRLRIVSAEAHRQHHGHT
jgi:hypothetical protein